ncbi:MAG: transcriptional regulator [Acidobacteria bacterium]|nr:transcriptional regulator [Acidobacteriota bacterium]
MGLTHRIAPSFQPGVYAQLLVQALPRIIETPRDHDQAVATLEKLDFPERQLSPEEQALAKLLERLILDYEERVTVNVPDASPLEVLKLLMSQHGLRQCDLLEVFGSSSVASAVLNGRRAISKNHARKLGEFFRLDAGAFL